MPDTFAITIIFIIAVTFLGAFIKGRTKDRCLRHFSGYPVTLEKKDSKKIWGKLRVENSCLEFVYAEPYLDEKDKHFETSCVVYKNEFGQIFVLLRYVDDLSGKELARRDKVLKKSHYPGRLSVLGRKVRNIFGTVKDSMMEIVNMFVGKMKTATPMGKVLAGQDKYVSQIQSQIITGTGMSYEPILERYIGRKVVLALTKDGQKYELSGVLRDYTAEFIEIMDVDYSPGEDQIQRKADIVIPRSSGVVRHLGEE